MFQFVRKVRRTGNHVDDTALASATDTVQGESKVTVLTDTLPTEIDTASPHDAVLEEETDTISAPNTVLQENRHADSAPDTMLQEEMGTASAPSIVQQEQDTVLDISCWHVRRGNRKIHGF